CPTTYSLLLSPLSLHDALPIYAASLHPTNGILMVTRLDGPTAAIARGLVDKAIQAETDGLWGRAYFDVRGLTNGSYKLGDDWIRSEEHTSELQSRVDLVCRLLL